MSTPQRIQLSRRRGWRKPEGAIVVARPSRWGNPVRMDGDRAAAAEWFGVGLDMRRAGTLPPGNAFHAYPTDAEIRDHLAGHDLACWCPLIDKDSNPVPCHADVLLELCREPGEGTQCPTCAGDGWIIDHDEMCYEAGDCVGCHGRRVQCDDPRGHADPCSSCDGNGQVWDPTANSNVAFCRHCTGGWIYR